MNLVLYSCIGSLQLAHTFAKLPRPGDSEVIFNSFEIKLLPANCQTNRR